MTELFWDQSLLLIEEGRVVPVVGVDLLTMANGQLLYPYLAGRLATYLGVSPENLTPGNELDDVACRYLANNGDHPISRIYTALKRVANEAEALPPSEPLRQLAAIRPLQLFVTTSFDSSLTRALDEVRFGGKQKTRVLTYNPSAKEDLPEDFKGNEPMVYHLLGKLSVTPSYAVTQWDMVEYFQALQSETRRPHLLLDELDRQSMLVLGSSFGGWLARFFLRMAKGQLSAGIQTADYIADSRVSEDAGLVFFIRHLGRGTEIYQGGGVVEFVGELHRRWMERNPPVEAGVAPPMFEALAGAPAALANGAVFLSYASEDRPAAERIKNALEAKGVEVFFDRDQLQAGEAWEEKIRRSVRSCSLFIPVISHHTLTSARRDFRTEWSLALEEAQKSSFADEESFLLPVVIDGTGQSAAGIPPRFATVQWQAWPAGETSDVFVERVQKLYRKYQKSISAGAL